MLSCWNMKADRRPSFRSLTDKFENILLNSEDYLDVETVEEDTANTCDIDYFVHDNDAEESDSLIPERYVATVIVR